MNSDCDRSTEGCWSAAGSALPQWVSEAKSNVAPIAALTNLDMSFPLIAKNAKSGLGFTPNNTLASQLTAIGSEPMFHQLWMRDCALLTDDSRLLLLRRSG